MWFHLCFVGYIREYVYGGGRVYIDDTDHFWVYIDHVSGCNECDYTDRKICIDLGKPGYLNLENWNSAF